ncbi:MAG: thioesterase family protein [Deltaproteobacteria bacterium]|nr:thioesterase family protein [Deltaproteobacteria bacterium]
MSSRFEVVEARVWTRPQKAVRTSYDHHLLKPEKRSPRQLVWIRADDVLRDSPLLHQCVVAYASDMTLMDTATLPHAVSWFDSRFQMASLDHAMWFHRSFRADEWLLYAQESPTASGGRGFTTGTLVRRDGRLVVSVAQEGLIRRRRGGEHA